MACLVVMLLHRVASTSAAVAATSARNDEIRLLAETLADLEPDEIAPVVAYLSGEILQGRIGVGWATAAKLVADEVETPTLTVDDLDSAFEALAGISGPGSVAARRRAALAAVEGHGNRGGVRTATHRW
ncbi:MAG: hypothetical protein R2710_21395 [Acidimicrobiales bacterium]